MGFQNKIHEPQETASQAIKALATVLRNGTEEDRRLAVQEYLNNNKDRLEEAQNEIVDIDGRAIKYIPSPAESTQLKAIRKAAIFAIYIDGITENARRLAININPSIATIFTTTNETEIIEAISQDPTIIRQIKYPTIEMQLAAIRVNPIYLVIITNPDPVVEIEALESQPDLIERIDVLSYKAQMHLVAKNPAIVDRTTKFRFEPEVIALSIKLRAEEAQ